MQGREVMKEKPIEQLLKPKKAFLRIALISMIISFVFYGIAIYMEKTAQTPEAVDYGSLIEAHKDREHDYVTTTIQYIALFAERQYYDIRYYYIQDTENHVMIAELSDETYQKIEEAYLQSGGTLAYELEGYIFDLPDDVLPLAIQSLPEVFDMQGNVITDENYQNYFGATYLHEGATPRTGLNAFLLGTGALLDVAAVVFLALYLTSAIKIRRYAKKIDMQMVRSELQQAATLPFSQARIYLTDHYIVSVVNGLLRITNYQDLLWLYIKAAKQYSTTVNLFLVGATRKGRPFYLATSLQEDLLNHIMALIRERNGNILIGYTAENKERYAALQKDFHL